MWSRLKWSSFLCQYLNNLDPIWTFSLRIDLVCVRSSGTLPRVTVLLVTEQFKPIRGESVN